MNVEKMNLVNAGCKFDGTIELEGFSRFNGRLKGKLRGLPGSELILEESAVVEGEVEGETIYIDGFVRGIVSATKKVVIGQTGRVLGEVKAPSMAVKFGGFFDGHCEMTTIAP